jgi:UDP-N-acetylmuramoyl-L-alanyl-D-glutamate--2,6-diaminopimelate ligase
MFREGILDKVLIYIKKLIPKSVFNFFEPMYHTALAYIGAILYGYPSRSIKVIGVTGTKGKSTVTFLISKILEANNNEVAAIGSLGYKIKDKEWPNTLKMTMPGRFKLQKFLAQAKRAGCKYVVLEVTSEGIKQKRHLGIKFDCAVFTTLHKEHIESHGSFENYYKAKQELFKRTKNIHVINADDKYTELFGNFPARHKIFYGLKKGDLVADKINQTEKGISFEVYGTTFQTHLKGEFNVMNCLAALAVGAIYGIDIPKMKPVLESINTIPGRMEYIQKSPFAVIVDYAHTPESLMQVYQTLKSEIQNLRPQNGSKFQTPNSKLICVLGAAGGGRDKWKRPEFGKIAGEYCDEIILTDEDPYEEDPVQIVSEIKSGISNSKFPISKVREILDRREAIKTGLKIAHNNDIVIITGKGSETSIAISGNIKIPWSDSEVTRELLKEIR